MKIALLSRNEPVPDSNADNDVAAIAAAVSRIGRAHTKREIMTSAMDSITEYCGWAYGSYWELDGTSQQLQLSVECELGASKIDPVIAKTRSQVRSNLGDALPRKAWETRDLVFVCDISEIVTGNRLAAAQAAGIKSGLCIPISKGDTVIGAMDFFTLETETLSTRRIHTLRCIAELVSQALLHISEREDQLKLSEDVKVSSELLRRTSHINSKEEALKAALDTIREGYGWEYGSFWRLDQQSHTLVFGQESGDVNAEFRTVTLSASFAEGVGLSGRAWKRRDLVFVEDLGQLNDCVRAPIAQKAGVRSGLCMPIIVDGEVIGTMDFFVTSSLSLSTERENTLRDTAFLVAQILQRFDGSERLERAGRELVSSITEVERNVLSATTVASQGQERAEAASETISMLASSSREIGDVAKVIQDIAAQTNLLALNATIEAARAGEAGRGFGVVATEVKELASQTASATSNVDSKVSAIQRHVNDVTDAIRSIQETVEKINHTQTVISGVLTQQVAVTKAILE